MHLSFIRGIKLNLTDDLRRLVFADWLEENGETELAVFIRLQCHKAEPISTKIVPGIPNEAVYEIAKQQSIPKQIRLEILAHGEKWAKHCLPSGTTSGDFAAFDKLEGQKYGQISRFSKEDMYRDMSGEQLYTFDVSDYEHWNKNKIDWTARFELDTDDNFWSNTLANQRLDKSGIAISRGFPSHWRGKVIDWFTKVGREAVTNYPIERVEFSDLLNSTGNRWNEEIRRRYPQVCDNRHFSYATITLSEIQDQLSRLAISYFE